MKEQGIYSIWLPDRSKVYVGSSVDIKKRKGGHSASLYLGCTFEILELTEGLTSSELRRKEDEWILRFREEGKPITNPTNKELLKISTDLGREALHKSEGWRRSVSSMLKAREHSPKWREGRSAAIKKAWETRKAKAKEVQEAKPSAAGTILERVKG